MPESTPVSRETPLFENAGPVSRETPLFENAGPVSRETRSRYRSDPLPDQWGQFLEAEDYEELLWFNSHNESLPASHRDEDVSQYKEINYDGY